MNFREKHSARIASGHRVPVQRKNIDELGVVDPWDNFKSAPEFEMGHGILPKVYERYTQDRMAEFGGDPSAYACAFLAMHVGVLHTSVEMQTRPNMKHIWRNPNEHSLTLGKSGVNKSGMLKDLTRHQQAWMLAMSKGASKRKGPIVRPLLTQGSVEGVFRQIYENKGERLVISNDEAMSFYQGSGSHHSAGALSVTSDLICHMYDGSPYTKRLVNDRNSYDIDKCFGTMLMATVFENLSGWDGFAELVRRGAMARTTVGLITRNLPRDATKLIPSADADMEHALLRLRSLRDCRFALEPKAARAWSTFIDAREAFNTEMVEMREPEGLVNWCKKYDMRIMSIATVLQAYDYTSVEEAARTHDLFDVPQEPDKVGGDEPRQGKLVAITFENLSRAIDFESGFLMQTQRHFYEVAQGAAEFGPELKNWIAHRVATDEPDNPDSRIISRNELTNSGPSNVRAKGNITDVVKEKQSRWIRALLDYGFVEVYEHPKQRKLKQVRVEEGERWYKLRDEVFIKFKDRVDQLREHDSELQGRLQRLRDRLPPKLGNPD